MENNCKAENAYDVCSNLYCCSDCEERDCKYRCCDYNDEEQCVYRNNS